MKLLRFGVGFGILVWFGGLFFWVFVLLFGFMLLLGIFLVFFGLCLCCAVYLLEQDDSSFYLPLAWGWVGFSLEFCGVGSVDRF